MFRLPLCVLAVCFAVTLITSTPASSQQPISQSFFAHNAMMSKVQPPMITPLVAPDPRLVQYMKFSFANQYTTSGTQTVNFGNSRGGGIIAGDRFEFDLIPPPYIEHNSKALDGFGDFSSLVKYRIASRNAKTGNYIVTAILARSFATGSHKNGAQTDSFTPSLVFGKGFGKFDTISSLGGTLPTGKISQQGRCIAWNEVIQMHATRSIWLEVENNAAYWVGGSRDGKFQNFVTPTVFYVIRPKEWKPTHPFFIIDAGMQIATSDYYTYNHNTISEFRILF